MAGVRRRAGPWERLPLAFGEEFRRTRNAYGRRDRKRSDGFAGKTRIGDFRSEEEGVLGFAGRGFGARLPEWGNGERSVADEGGRYRGSRSNQAGTCAVLRRQIQLD